ncbi:hypothetical protein N7456_011023 [Penicillium angulare]|uniref:Uncharacterized protein n=1 Tax=Penicillium angulare TaxID=116970 RepID=A0A9W9K0B5_9EURO|nr:hypothetical protein N7456_011023 [Penicillium angulare]
MAVISRVAPNHFGDAYIDSKKEKVRQAEWIQHLPLATQRAWNVFPNTQEEEQWPEYRAIISREAGPDGYMGLHFAAHELPVEDYNTGTWQRRERYFNASIYDDDDDEDTALERSFQYNAALREQLLRSDNPQPRKEDYISAALKLLTAGQGLGFTHQEAHEGDQAATGVNVNKPDNGIDGPIWPIQQSPLTRSSLPSLHRAVPPSINDSDEETPAQLPFPIPPPIDLIPSHPSSHPPSSSSPPYSPSFESPYPISKPTLSESMSGGFSKAKAKKNKGRKKGKKNSATKAGPSANSAPLPPLPSAEESVERLSSPASPVSTCTAIHLGTSSQTDVAPQLAEELVAEKRPQDIIASDSETTEPHLSPARHAGSDRSSPHLSSTPLEAEPEVPANVPAASLVVPGAPLIVSGVPESWWSSEDQLPSCPEWDMNLHHHGKHCMFWIHEDGHTEEVDITTLDREDAPECLFCIGCRQHRPEKLCWCSECLTLTRWCCCAHYPSYCNYPGQQEAYERYLQQFGRDCALVFPNPPASEAEGEPRSPYETEEVPADFAGLTDTSDHAVSPIPDDDETIKAPDDNEEASTVCAYHSDTSVPAWIPISEARQVTKSPDKKEEAVTVCAGHDGTSPPAVPEMTEVLPTKPKKKKKRRKQWPKGEGKMKTRNNRTTPTDSTPSPGPSPPQDPTSNQTTAVETLSLKNTPKPTPKASPSPTTWDVPKLFTPIEGALGSVEEPDFLWEFAEESSFVWKRKPPTVVRRMSWPVSHLAIDEKFVDS